MKKQFLETGKIVGTHGVNGMVRIQAWADSGDFLTRFKKFYLDESGEASVKVKNIKPHGTVVIAKLEGIDTIEQAEKLRNKVIFISRKDVKLPEGRYFVEDLTGCKVFHQNGEELGILAEVTQTGANDVWHIKRNDKEYLVPAIDEVIVSVDIDDEKIVLNPMKGIFEDAD